MKGKEREGKKEEGITRGEDREKILPLPEPKLPENKPIITPEKTYIHGKKKENSSKNVSASTTLLPGNKNSDKIVIKSEKVEKLKPLERGKKSKVDKIKNTEIFTNISILRTASSNKLSAGPDEKCGGIMDLCSKPPTPSTRRPRQHKDLAGGTTERGKNK